MKKRLILTAVLLLVVLVGTSGVTLANPGVPTTQRDLDEFIDFAGARVDMPYHWISDDGLRLIPYYDTQMLLDMIACPGGMIECWLLALEDYQADPTRDQTEMWGTITERPLADGTALIHANLHYRNLDFVIVDQYMTTTLVIDGEAEATLNWQFIIPYPGAPLSTATEETVSVHLNTRGEGFLTGMGGYDPGPARVKVNMVGLHFGEDTPQTPNTYCWGDYCEMWPVESIRLTPRNN